MKRRLAIVLLLGIILVTFVYLKQDNEPANIIHIKKSAKEIGNQTDYNTKTYYAYLEKKYGNKKIKPGQLLDTILIDVDHDGLNEIIVFEYCGDYPIDDGELNEYLWKVYKNYDGNIKKIFQDTCNIRLQTGARGKDVGTITLDGKDYLAFEYRYRELFQTTTLVYLKNNELAQKIEVVIMAKEDYMYDVEVNDMFYDASIDGEKCLVEKAKDLLDEFDKVLIPVRGMQGDGDYLGKKWGK